MCSLKCDNMPFEDEEVVGDANSEDEDDEQIHFDRCYVQGTT